MNLKNRQITVGELLDYPPARTVLQKRFPIIVKHVPTGEGRTVTLAQLVDFLGPYIPKILINDAIRELERA